MFSETTSQASVQPHPSVMLCTHEVKDKADQLPEAFVIHT